MNLFVTHVGCLKDRGHVTEGWGDFWDTWRKMRVDTSRTQHKIQRFASNAAIFFMVWLMWYFLRVFEKKTGFTCLKEKTPVSFLETSSFPLIFHFPWGVRQLSVSCCSLRNEQYLRQRKQLLWGDGGTTIMSWSCPDGIVCWMMQFFVRGTVQ